VPASCWRKARSVWCECVPHSSTTHDSRLGPAAGREGSHQGECGRSDEKRRQRQMRHRAEHNSPETRDRANVRLRRLTRSAVLAATGATALIGVVVAKEHPGAGSGAGASGKPPAQSATTPNATTPPTSSTPTSTPTTSTPTTSTPTSAPASGGSAIPTTAPTTLAPTTTTTTTTSRPPTTTTTRPVVTSGGTSR
jgi:hypothetical protein